MGQFQEALRGHACILWWGKLDDLISGTGEFQEQVREDFHAGSDEEEPEGRAIAPEMIDDFAEFLRTYGI